MLVLHNKKELQEALQPTNYKNYTIGFVPTMGALHKGHLSLVKKACAENKITVVSIFINPTQFDIKEDLEKYPSNLENDLDLLQSISEDILVFTPSAVEIYNKKIISKKFDFNGLENVMEGVFRPGHFNGVATIVELLLLAVMPTHAYFGEKDFQQLQIIKKLAEINKLPFKIIGCPIEREPNGLARSSRNERISVSTREKSGIIFKTLKVAKTKFGTESANSIKQWVTKEFEKNKVFKLEYFEIADAETLRPILKKEENVKYRAFIAVYAEGIRLIDNIAL